MPPPPKDGAPLAPSGVLLAPVLLSSLFPRGILDEEGVRLVLVGAAHDGDEEEVQDEVGVGVGVVVDALCWLLFDFSSAFFFSCFFPFLLRVQNGGGGGAQKGKSKPATSIPRLEKREAGESEE